MFMTNQAALMAIKGGLIVSCQALATEPLHSSYIMSRMAVAAWEGGAVGLRANTVADIVEIRKLVKLPMIGIIKEVYGQSPVYITPTMREVDALAETGVEIIAIDATSRPRPDGSALEATFAPIRKKYPNQLFMADCATFEEAVFAEKIGFDLAGTTLCGYTEDTKGSALPAIDLLGRLGATLDIPLIAEGGIWTPAQLKTILAMPGVHAAVIGSAITRPQDITRHFLAGLH